MSFGLVNISLKGGWAQLTRWPEKLRAATKDLLEITTNEARNHVNRVGFSGGPAHLFSRNGAAGLKGSVSRFIEDRWPIMTGGLRTNLVYAAVHEFGAVIKAKRSPYLKFKIGDRWVHKKEVTIPARPYLHPALEDAAKKIPTYAGMVLRRHFGDAVK